MFPSIGDLLQALLAPQGAAQTNNETVCLAPIWARDHAFCPQAVRKYQIPQKSSAFSSSHACWIRRSPSSCRTTPQVSKNGRTRGKRRRRSEEHTSELQSRR